MAAQDTDHQNQSDGYDADADGYAYAAASTGIGAMLKATRLRIGADLRDVAKTLHIRFIYLQAIEDGRYEDLPGTAYALGFIRSYADYLGLDNDEVIRRFKSETSNEKTKSSTLIFPVPIPESSMPGGAILFIGFVLAVLAYGGWYLSTTKDGYIAELISPLPARLSALLPGGDDGAAKNSIESTEDTAPAPETTVEAASETPLDQASGEIAEITPKAVPQTGDETATGETTPVAVEQAVKSVEQVSKPVGQTTQKMVKPVTETTESTVTVAESAPQTVTPEPTPPTTKMVQSQPTKPAEPVANLSQPATTMVPETTIAAVVPVQTPTPVAPAAASKVPATTATEAVIEPVVKPAVEVAATSTASPVITPTAPAAPPPAASIPQGRIYGVADDHFRIEVKALKNSWIQVRDDTANTLILTRLLRVGDSYRVPDRQGLKLLTGNAGALEILVDGKAVPPIGGSGAVRRSVALNPDRLVQGQAVE